MYGYPFLVGRHGHARRLLVGLSEPQQLRDKDHDTAIMGLDVNHLARCRTHKRRGKNECWQRPVLS